MTEKTLGRSAVAAAPPRRRPALGERAAAWLRDYGLSLAFVVTILVVWQVVQARAGRGQFVLPTPLTIAGTLIEDADLLARNAWPTILEAAMGFAIGNLVGILLAVVFVYSPFLEDTFYPVAVVLRSIPLIAITPVLVIWLGPGFASKVALTALITFFPTLVNMVQGLSAADTAALELMHTLAASERQVFWKIRVPYALPYFFASMRIAGPAAVLGAMVAEWIGSTRGLGYVLLQSMFNFQTARTWAALVVATLLSILTFALITSLERWLVPWRLAARDVTVGED